MTEPYKIEITTTAEIEAKEAILWIKQRSPEAAEKFSKGLIKAVKSLQSNPLRCPLAPENDFFYEEIRQLVYAKYRILFTVEGKTVYVLHIRHGSQAFLRQSVEDEEG
jgi:plasmid stabilization system protein ParE